MVPLSRVIEPDRLKLIYLHFWGLHCRNINLLVWLTVNCDIVSVQLYDWKHLGLKQ